MIQTSRTVKDMPTSLRGIANRAKRDSKAKFRNLYRLLNKDNLRWSFYQLKRSAAPGVDKVSFQQYEAELESKLEHLVERLKAKRYRAKLVRRKNIPKSGGKLRPLGIPALEDKLLQLAVARILESIYEQDFLETSWGYRAGRGPQQASRVLAGRLAIGKYHWVVEADIREFFNRLDHTWMMKMLAERIEDAALSGLIMKWMKAGVLEEHGKVVHPQSGTPQGGIISPVLANIYLHYALDLWFEKVVRKRQTSGQAMIMRYADDFVCGFEHRHEAEAFMGKLRERLGKFSLELAEDKSGIRRFSRHQIAENGHFCFLGFKYHWMKSLKGRPKVQRTTDPKKLRGSLAAFSEWIKRHRHQRSAKLMEQLKRKLEGYWGYYGVTGNSHSLQKFWWQAVKLLYKWLNRRSQRGSYSWKGLYAVLAAFGIKGPRITENAKAKQDPQRWFAFT